jgi:hypothetical protein
MMNDCSLNPFDFAGCRPDMGGFLPPFWLTELVEQWCGQHVTFSKAETFGAGA